MTSYDPIKSGAWMVRIAYCMRRTNTIYGVLSGMLNLLWPSDAIMENWIWVNIGSHNGLLSGAPSHYLNQCWLIISGVMWLSPEISFTVSAQATFLYNEYGNCIFNIAAHISKGPMSEKSCMEMYFQFRNFCSSIFLMSFIMNWYICILSWLLWDTFWKGWHRVLQMIGYCWKPIF